MTSSLVWATWVSYSGSSSNGRLLKVVYVVSFSCDVGVALLPLFRLFL